MHWIFYVVLGVILLKLALQLLLEALNRSFARAQADKVPPHLEGIVTPEAHAASASYTLEHSSLDLGEMIFGVVLKIVVISCGVLPAVYIGVIGNFGLWNFWAQALGISLIGIILSLFFWPFDWAATFGIEQKYGFNRQTPQIWLTDQLKGYAVSLVLSVPLLTLVLWMASGGLKNWWLWVFLVMMAFELVLEFLYPAFIEPLFNKFTPLPDGPLKERLSALCQRAGVNFKKILVMDASRRTRHANAYFAGIGDSRRIVLYDTLLEQLSDEEVEAVLAHEIGHMKHQHTLRGLYVSGAWQLLGLFILNALLDWATFYRAFGFSIAEGKAGVFLLLSIIAGAFTFWLRPLMAQWYRTNEYQADATASKLVGRPQPLLSGLKKLTKESLHSIEDHPLSHAFYASHPTLRQREVALEKLFPAQ